MFEKKTKDSTDWFAPSTSPVRLMIAAGLVILGAVIIIAGSAGFIEPDNGWTVVSGFGFLVGAGAYLFAWFLRR